MSQQQEKEQREEVEDYSGLSAQEKREKMLKKKMKRKREQTGLKIVAVVAHRSSSGWVVGRWGRTVGGVVILK